jgi:hypothetical protein
MAILDIDDLIRKIDAYDDEPPFPGYDVEEFGKQIAEECDPKTAREVVFACFTRVTNTLAECFLAGFLSVATLEDLDSLLMECLVATKFINAAHAIDTFLVTRAGLDVGGIANRLLDRLAMTEDLDVQANLSYGLYALTCVCAYDFQEERTYRLWTYSPSHPTTIRLRERIQALLQASKLTQYARDSLIECANCAAKTLGEM